MLNHMLVQGEPLIVGEIPSATVLTASASCPAGWVAMGGGGHEEDFKGHSGYDGTGPLIDAAGPVLLDSFPTDGGATWTVTYQSNGWYIASGKLTAYAQCVQFSS